MPSRQLAPLGGGSVSAPASLAGGSSRLSPSSSATDASGLGLRASPLASGLVVDGSSSTLPVLSPSSTLPSSSRSFGSAGALSSPQASTRSSAASSGR